MTTISTEKATDLLRTHLRYNGKSANTVRAYTADATQFLEAAGGSPDLISDPDAFQAKAFIYLDAGRRTWRPATVSRKLTSLRALSDALFEDDVLAGYKAPSVGRPPAHPLPGGIPDVVALIKATDNEHHRAMIALCGLAGLRISETRAVTTAHFTTDAAGNRWLRILGKGDRERTIPLSRRCLDFVEPILDFMEPNRLLFNISDRGARKMITALGYKALGRPVASHDLRMTFGTEVHDSTNNLRVTQELLGHASSVTTERYTAVRDDALKAAVEL